MPTSAVTERPGVGRAVAAVALPALRAAVDYDICRLPAGRHGPRCCCSLAAAWLALLAGCGVATNYASATWSDLGSVAIAAKEGSAIADPPAAPVGLLQTANGVPASWRGLAKGGLHLFFISDVDGDGVAWWHARSGPPKGEAPPGANEAGQWLEPRRLQKGYWGTAVLHEGECAFAAAAGDGVTFMLLAADEQGAPGTTAASPAGRCRLRYLPPLRWSLRDRSVGPADNVANGRGDAQYYFATLINLGSGLGLFANVDKTGGYGRHDLVFARSADGGERWGEEVTVASDVKPDEPMPIAAAAIDKRPYVFYHDTASGGVASATSGDDGASWTKALIGTEGDGQRTVAIPLAADVDDGAIWLVYELIGRQEGRSTYRLAVSRDEGAAWETLGPIAPTETKVGPLAHNVSFKARGGKLAFVRTVTRAVREGTSGAAEIEIYTSDDRGRNWQRHVTAGEEGYGQFLPILELSPDAKALHLAYNRKQPGSNKVEIAIRTLTPAESGKPAKAK